MDQVGAMIVRSHERAFRRGGGQVGEGRAKVLGMSHEEVCGDCGWRFKIPDFNARCVYRQCPMCLRSLPEIAPLSIPPPHPVIGTKEPYKLCMARTNVQGVAKKCEQRRADGTDFCRRHNRTLKTYGTLPYGRHDLPYEGDHPLEFPEENDDDGDEDGQDVCNLNEQKVTEEEKFVPTQQLVNQRDIGAEDTLLLKRAHEIWDYRDKKGYLDREKITVDTVANVLEPTFGINLRGKNGAPSRMEWLQEGCQALLSLPKVRLGILAAVIGHPVEPAKSVDCSKALKRLISLEGGRRLKIGTGVDVLDLLDKEDPCPGEQKALRMRYVLDGTVGELTLHLDDYNELERPVLLCLPEERETIGSRLTIARATYGHPHDASLVFDITEKIQGLTDINGDGRYIYLQLGTDLSRTFGEPCRGVVKRINISYIIDGKYIELIVPESNDRLLEPIRIAAPIVAPAITITYATLSPKLLVGRKFGAKTDRKTMLLNYSHFKGKQDHRRAKKTSIRCVDDDTVIVTEELRRVVGAQGGDTLVLEKDVDLFYVLSSLPNANSLRQRFRNKELVLHFEYRANNILKENKVTTDKRHVLQDHINIDARPVSPAILINSAVYGHPTDQKLQFNVQEALEERVRKRAGRILEISTAESLHKMFGDPCYPHHTNKILHIRAEVQKMVGRAHSVVSLDGILTETLRIGWPNDVEKRLENFKQL